MVPNSTTYYFQLQSHVALSQLTTGSIMIAVTLMIMASEIDISMSVTVFEEMTTVSAKHDMVFTFSKMRSSPNI